MDSRVSIHTRLCSQRQIREEALANIRDAITACLEERAERGMPLTIEMQQIEVAL